MKATSVPNTRREFISMLSMPIFVVGSLGLLRSLLNVATRDGRRRPKVRMSMQITGPEGVDLRQYKVDRHRWMDVAQFERITEELALNSKILGREFKLQNGVARFSILFKDREAASEFYRKMEIDAKLDRLARRSLGYNCTTTWHTVTS